MLRQEQLLSEIKRIHAESRGIYGSPKVLRELRSKGIIVNHKTVEELMKKNGIRAKRKKKFKATTDSNHNLPIAKHRLKRNFEAKKPNQKWVSDITYIHTGEGWLYLAAFIDLYSRKVVGWSMSARMTADIVVDAFRMALFRQKRKAPRLVHSDRGSQYASDAFRSELKAHGCKQSMSRKGNCWDNGVPRMHAKEAACRKAA
jgi:transposase InsO family protein